MPHADYYYYYFDEIQVVVVVDVVAVDYATLLLWSPLSPSL
jgi:hypothetical protein